MIRDILKRVVGGSNNNQHDNVSEGYGQHYGPPQYGPGHGPAYSPHGNGGYHPAQAMIDEGRYKDQKYEGEYEDYYEKKARKKARKIYGGW